MDISDEQAIVYISGIVQSMKVKMDIADSQSDDNEELYIPADERMLYQCMEILLVKAKANIMFIQDGK